MDFLIQESLLYTSFSRRQKVSVQISLSAQTDLGPYFRHNAGFLVERLIYTLLIKLCISINYVTILNENPSKQYIFCDL